jgi:hypothetical protein
MKSDVKTQLPLSEKPLFPDFTRRPSLDLMAVLRFHSLWLCSCLTYEPDRADRAWVVTHQAHIGVSASLLGWPTVIWGLWAGGLRNS